mmetsp:Transcript_37734/g.55412  ORF Transcript_37734/g.55412 Transcript_37734/m.55412 type:complete len:92 (+) Transcript_37734:276-551(+)
MKKCVPVAKGRFPQRPAWGTVSEFVSDDDETQLPYEHETELEDAGSKRLMVDTPTPHPTRQSTDFKGEKRVRFVDTKCVCACVCGARKPLH